MTARGPGTPTLGERRLQYVSVSTLPSSSANAIQVSRMCEAFANAGRGVRLHARANRRSGRVSDTEVFAYYGVAETFELSLYRGRVLRDARMGLRAGMASGAVIYGRNISAAHLSARLGRPVVLEIHHPFGPERAEHAHLKRLSRERCCLGIVAISNALARRLAEDFPGFAGRILVAPDAANPLTATTASASAAGASSGFHVGYAGSLYAGKGFRRIVDLAQQLPWATFHVIGDTHPLAKRGIDIEALPPNVVMHGHQHPHRVGDLIAGCDVLLAPYRRQVKPHASLDIAPWMSPLKVFEYMSAAKPIVASDLPVIREVLTHEETALLCAAEDDAAWLTALTRLAREPQLAGRLATNAHALWADHYTWDARARAILTWMDDRLAAAGFR